MTLRTVLTGAFLALLAVTQPQAAEHVTKTHALSLTGEPKYPPAFTRLDYVNPDAPKGGELRRAARGGFDSLNPFIIKGNPAAGIGLTVESLTTSPMDDISTEYGLIAESMEVPDDASWVIFNIRPIARFHDGSPVRAEDVIFSFNLLREKGAPFYRFYYRNVKKAEKLGPLRVKFTFASAGNRELPQIMGQLVVLSEKEWQKRDFSATTLEPFLGTGPYKVEKIDVNRSIVLKRDPDYWGKDLPINRGRYNFDRVRFDYFRDETASLEAFKSGAYDFRAENMSKTWATAYDFPALRAGLVRKEEIPHSRPTGMQAFAFNIRRPVFQDRTLRWAIAHAFDFEWSNKNLFYNQYTRTRSYFSNSPLASTGLPSKAELALLEPLRGEVPAEVFTKTYEPPSTKVKGGIRTNLRKAARMLKKAGYTVRGGKLISPFTGKAVSFEILLADPGFERVVLPFAANLKRLGIEARLRTIDAAQYQNRVRDFDFDMIVASWGQSLSPGNEQRNYWSSQAAERPGSRNLIGIKSAAVDALIDKIIFAPDRPSLVAATRALDRVLLWGHYVVPQWHITHDRIAYWIKLGRPAKTPDYGVDIWAWWIDGEGEAKIRSWRQSK